MKREIENRVGAILGANEKSKILKFFGFGVIVADEIPKDAVGFLADILKESGNKNPCIKLDSGKKVYGCECWWGGEEKMKEVLERYKENGFTIVDVDIDEVRKEIKDGENGKEK